MKFEGSIKFARQLDKKDPLRSFRNQFHIPFIAGKKAIYFTGNSLGLQPKIASAMVNEELDTWARLAVEGHFDGKRPWMPYHKFFKKALADIVGARPSEVVATNQLTVNLHLMMVSFFRPTQQRYKIICEQGAFPSDQYALESQAKFHHLNPDACIIELRPRPEEHTLRTDDILKTIEDHARELALVMVGGVQYYTGQFFDIEAITAAGHRAGAIVGFDLAHAVGNVPLQLHKHDVDFAVWCSYKYLNSGPGGVAGLFVHERHGKNFNIPRFAGWWGHNEKERFLMKKGFQPMEGADGWQLSNFPILTGAAHLASLSIFQKAGMRNLRKKSERLTSFLYFLLKKIDPDGSAFTIITPADPDQRGCQLSILMSRNGKKVFDKLSKGGVVADWREPNVIRVAPVPLYNTFEDVFRFAEILERAIIHS